MRHRRLTVTMAAMAALAVVAALLYVSFGHHHRGARARKSSPYKTRAPRGSFCIRRILTALSIHSAGMKMPPSANVAPRPFGGGRLVGESALSVL
jgi:hypothetical protein